MARKPKEQPTQAPDAVAAADPPARPFHNDSLHPALVRMMAPEAINWKEKIAKRRKAGKHLIKDEAELMALVKDYLITLHKSPLREARPTGDNDSFLTMKHKPATVVGLCAFAGFSRRIWYLWRDDTAEQYREDLVDAMERVTDEFYAAMMEQAATGEIAPGFTARYLGIGDKTEISLKGDSKAAGDRVEQDVMAAIGALEDGEVKEPEETAEEV